MRPCEHTRRALRPARLSPRRSLSLRLSPAADAQQGRVRMGLASAPARRAHWIAHCHDHLPPTPTINQEARPPPARPVSPPPLCRSSSTHAVT